MDQYLEKYTVLGQRKFIIYDMKIKKLEAGAGFHSWHYENGDYLSCGRTFVVQTYLNDDFDGGETEFLYINKREKASTGDVIIFPCQYTHTHRGNPPEQVVQNILLPHGDGFNQLQMILLKMKSEIVQLGNSSSRTFFPLMIIKNFYNET